MATTIRQTVLIDAPPHAVFEALLDSRKHSAFTGSKASLSRQVGGRISAWDGYIEGTNLRIEEDKVIVQAWRTTEFEAGDPDSQVMFHLSRKGDGTRLMFIHSKVPDRLAEELRQGWIDNYWTPLKAYLEPPKA
jgi:activator of HSP90 ATPase